MRKRDARFVARKRSVLLVDGDDLTAVDGAMVSGADAVLLDLAACDARERRGGASIAFRALSARSRAALAPAVYVRLSSLRGGRIDAQLDDAALLGPDGVLLSGATSVTDVLRLASRLTVGEALHGVADGSTGIIVAADNAAALPELPRLAQCSRRVAGLLWDAGALAADIGSTLPDADCGWPEPLALGRALCLLAAAAARVPALDTPLPPAFDQALFRAACVAARRDGFSGKIAASPAQVDVINEVFASE